MSTRLLSKGFKLVTTRPAQTYATTRGYLLFLFARVFRGLVLGASSGVRLGRNVRLQSLAALSAERPEAGIEIGDHSVVYENARIAAYGRGSIQVGERCVVGDVRIYSRASVRIGARVVFSWNVFIQDFHPHPVDPALRARQMVALTDQFLPAFDGHRPGTDRLAWDFPTDPVEVGDDVWLGANTTILPGARIGAGSIVAAGAVVVRGAYPARSVLAGNPAKVVKSL